jgi:hypothetical protein
MLLLRVALLELLVCFHVIGAAVLFRRLFPRESPWLAFIVPILVVMCVFNFLEHFIALANLGWLLPFTLAGLFWAMVRPGYSWDGLRLPGILFVAVFTWALFIKCMHPEITCNTEGVADMARMLDFSLGGKLPAIDSWCPPYDHGGYYTFQHYGASILQRLFSLDIGTGYNMGYNLLNTLTVLVGAGAAYSISGRKTWVAVATLLVLLANFTGAAVLLLFWNAAHPTAGVDVFDTRLAVDIADGWDDPARYSPLKWAYYHPAPTLRLFTPAFNTYFAEFHPNLGGHFMTLASLLAANEAYKTERSNWPWVCLLVFPFATIITAAWFFIVITVLCVGAIAAALLAGYRPGSWKFVLGATSLAFVLLWPSVDSLLSGTYPAAFHWTPWAEYTPFWEFVIQWWPIIVPWICLCFIWKRLSLLARWIHLALPLLLIFVEVATFGYRVPTVEKMWGAIYGAGLVTFLPLVFIQRNVAFRIVTVIFFFITTLFLAAWTKISTDYVDWQSVAFHIKGDTVFENNPQKKRLLQVLQSLHGATVLSGKSVWSYNEAPSIVGFSENRCYIAWFSKEDECGHGGIAELRDKLNNLFYTGTMVNPLGFLRSNDIAAVLIWPDDAIPDGLLQQFQGQLGSDYFYVDCKGEDGPNNAGVFLRQLSAPPSGVNSIPSAK